jgi:hypothetical protein
MAGSSWRLEVEHFPFGERKLQFPEQRGCNGPNTVGLLLSSWPSRGFGGGASAIGSRRLPFELGRNIVSREARNF